MVDITDDKHGKRDKQMQRGITMLVAAFFGFVVVLVIWQHSHHDNRHLRRHNKEKHYPGEHVKELGHKSVETVFSEKKSVLLDKLYSNGYHDNPEAGKPSPQQHHTTFAHHVKEVMGRKLNKDGIIANSEDLKNGSIRNALGSDSKALRQRLEEKLHP